MNRSTVLTMLLFSFATFSFAHWADLATAEISIDGAQVDATLTFPTGLVAELDDDHSGELSVRGFARHRRALKTYLAERFKVVGDAGPPATLKLEADITELPVAPGIGLGAHSTVRLNYTFKRPPNALTLDYRLFLPSLSSASCLVTVLKDGTIRTYVLTPEAPTVRLAGARVPWWQNVARFTILGVAHIWSGYDHLLFLLTLLLLGSRLGYLLKVVSAFSVAHSVTLSLAVLGLVSLPDRLVESGIALSVAYVAAENLFRDPARAARWRWLLTFGFGIVHGLGFAGILESLKLPRESLAIALFGFNLGVEFGQVAVVCLLAAALHLVRCWRYTPRLRWAMSVAALLLGLVWFIERAFIV